jgi:hypothetical protein
MTTDNLPDPIVELTGAQTALGDGRDARSDNEPADRWTATTSYQTHDQ